MVANYFKLRETEPLMVRKVFAFFLLSVITFERSLAVEGSTDVIFSGPQPGEKVPSLPVELLTGERAGQQVDLVQEAGDQPSVIFFIHQLTRPGFGLMRTIAGFAAERSVQIDGKDEGDSSRLKTKRESDSVEKMSVSVVFLTADKTETVQWAANVKRLFTDSVSYGVSLDGIEGPGAFGLNRNVTLTVLVCKNQKVVKNFALVQPQLQADGPGMIEAIVNVTGGGESPTLESIVGAGRAMMRRPQPANGGESNGSRSQLSPELARRFRGMLAKTATNEEVRQRAGEVEAYLEENPESKKELGRIVNTIIEAGRLENYGTTEAQSVLKRWKDQYGKSAPKADKPSRE